MSVRLLTTKLYIPPRRPSLMLRPRLMARLGEALSLQHRLILITAKAGSGKTTLVQGPVVLIPSGAVDKKAAADLLAWIMSPEVVAGMAYDTSTLPTSRIAARDPAFEEIPFFEVFMGLMAHPNARPAAYPGS